MGRDVKGVKINIFFTDHRPYGLQNPLMERTHRLDLSAKIFKGGFTGFKNPKNSFVVGVFFDGVKVIFKF